jgi:hypothetical protein
MAAKSPPPFLGDLSQVQTNQLRPPFRGQTSKLHGAAETGQLTIRSRSASRSSTCSTSNLGNTLTSSYSREQSPSLSQNCLRTTSNTASIGLLERSRSSGRLVSTSAAASPGDRDSPELKRGAAASTSVLPGATTSRTASPQSATTCAPKLSTHANVRSSCTKSTTSLSQQSCANANSTKHQKKPSPAGGTAGGGHNLEAGGSVTPDHRKSKKFLNQWRQKATMSKLGKGTRSLVRLLAQSSLLYRS